MGRQQQGGHRSAFSIVELLVAAAIGAGVIFGIYSLLGLGIASSSATEEQAELAQKLVFFAEKIQNDLRRVVGYVDQGDSYVLVLRVEKNRSGTDAVGYSQYVYVRYRVEDGGKVILREESGPVTAAAEDSVASGGVPGAGASNPKPPPPPASGAFPTEAKSTRIDFTRWLPGEETVGLRLNRSQTGSLTPTADPGGGEGASEEAGLTYVLTVGSSVENRLESRSVPFFDTLTLPEEGLQETVIDPEPTYTVEGSPDEDYDTLRADPEVQGTPVISRPTKSLGGAWVQFIDGGDAFAEVPEKGIFRGRTSLEGADGKPVIFRAGNPSARLGQSSSTPNERGDPGLDSILRASGDTEGVVVAEVPNGFNGTEVLVTASEGVEGTAGAEQTSGGKFAPVPQAESSPGGRGVSQGFGSGDPGGRLPADASIEDVLSQPPPPDVNPETPPPDSAFFPPAPPPLDPPGITPGAPPPHPRSSMMQRSRQRPRRSG
jgi:hypothetical protein